MKFELHEQILNCINGFGNIGSIHINFYDRSCHFVPANSTYLCQELEEIIEHMKNVEFSKQQKGKEQPNE